MKLKQAVVFSVLGCALCLPLFGCGDDDDDSGLNNQTGGSSSKAGSKATGGKPANSPSGGVGGQSTTPKPEGGDATSQGGEPNVDPECDAEGADAAMGKLLNAPVDSDVEVVVKKPQHPGKPGPLDLP